MIAPHERLVFLRDDRRLGVTNGTLGTVEHVASSHLQVRLDGPKGPLITFSLADYNPVDYGYAMTVHKAQGQIVEQAWVLATTHFDRHTGYVALTRHRERVELHYGQADLANAKALERALGRDRPKDLAIDYTATTQRNAELVRKFRQ